MNILVPRFLKSAYRKEPISAFILIVSVVDMVIGGFGQRWTLLSFGVMIALTAVVTRWLQTQKVREIPSERSARRFLPPAASPGPLPMLINEKHRR
jgi:hypothetical protein